jgi:hypothetical protein
MWVRLITVVVIILSSLAVILYLTVAGRILPILPVLVGNATVSQGNALKVTLMAFGATFKITSVTPLGGACRLTGVRINNASSSPTPPWILRSGQSAVFTFNCTNASKIIVTYNNGKTLIINIPRSHSPNYTRE